MVSGKVVVYYRVSTDRQGQSKLGMEAQHAAVAARVGDRQIVGSYQEIESGRRHTNRPELRKALGHAKREDAVLVVAKLDRLARNVAFVSALMEAGVKFLACDMPAANEFTLHIMAALAEQEAKMASTRIKEALAALKARGVKLGCPVHGKLDFAARSRGGKIGGARNKGRRKWRDPEAMRLVLEARATGASLRQIVALLEAAGHRGWYPATVNQICQEQTPQSLKRQVL